MNHRDILDFWFQGQTDRSDGQMAALWFKKNPQTDLMIKERFGDRVEAAAKSQLQGWLDQPETSLCYILLLDQFTRNIYRDQALSFAYDDLALKAALKGLDRDFDQQLPLLYRVFFYMPLMHSEKSEIQDLSIKKFSELLDQAPEESKSGFSGFLDYAHRHKNVIDRFGRYPHRNKILGRESSTDELEFLEAIGGF